MERRVYIWVGRLCLLPKTRHWSEVLTTKTLD